MFTSISLPQAAQFSSPNPVTLICTTKPDGSANLATVSWWTYLSYAHNKIAFAMAKISYTGERVREKKELVLTLPGTSLEKTALGCGSTSGRDTDKVSMFQVEMTKVPSSDIAIPVHSRLAICATLCQTVEVGDHYLYICDVTAVYGNEEETPLFAWGGYGVLAPAQKA